MSVCVNVPTGACICSMCMWRSEVISQDSVLSFYHVHPRDHTRVMKFDNKQALPTEKSHQSTAPLLYYYYYFDK